MKILKTTIWTAVGLFGLMALVAMPAAADQVILDDLIVDGSACIGFDCVNGESFGFDTIRIKENNLRIKAQDTSSTASFPTQDWQITFNDTTNGGANKFSIDAISPSTGTPFTIEAGAPTHSLYVDDGGRIGLGTSTPVACIHCKDGNTPTLRLEQDGSSGFTPQTWDVAGNEANFFIRDATNGSTLPFRIQPGAPSNMIFVEDNFGGVVGINTSSPDNGQNNAAKLDVNGVVLATGASGGIAVQPRDGTDKDWTIASISNTAGLIVDEGGVGTHFTVQSGGGVVITPMASPPTCALGAIYFDSSGALCLCTSAGGSFSVIGGAGTCV